MMEKYELHHFFLFKACRKFSGGEPIKAEIFFIENIQEQVKKTGGGKALKKNF